jgi:hypothetical protein
MMTMKGGNEEPANIQLRLISLLQTQIGRKNTYRLVYQYIYTHTIQKYNHELRYRDTQNKNYEL